MNVSPSRTLVRGIAFSPAHPGTVKIPSDSTFCNALQTGKFDENPEKTAGNSLKTLEKIVHLWYNKIG